MNNKLFSHRHRKRHPHLCLAVAAALLTFASCRTSRSAVHSEHAQATATSHFSAHTVDSLSLRRLCSLSAINPELTVTAFRPRDSLVAVVRFKASGLASTSAENRRLISRHSTLWHRSSQLVESNDSKQSSASSPLPRSFWLIPLLALGTLTLIRIYKSYKS